MTQEFKANREELVAAYEAARAVFKPLYDAAKAHVRSVVEDFATRHGFMGEVDIDVTERHVQIAVKDEKERHWYKTELFFERDWSDKAWRLKMSVGGYGTCGTDNPTQLKLYSIVGKLAGELDVLESALDLFDWAEYDAANRAVSDARYAVEKFDIDARRAEREAAREDARARLVPGATIMTGENSWNGTLYNTIERVTSKTLFTQHVRVFKGESSVPYDERIRIEEALEKIVSGKWKFVEPLTKVEG